MDQENPAHLKQYNADWKRKRMNKNIAFYSFEVIVLDKVGRIKFFGVTLANELKWNADIGNICTKANRTIG